MKNRSAYKDSLARDTPVESPSLDYDGFLEFFRDDLPPQSNRISLAMVEKILLTPNHEIANKVQEAKELHKYNVLTCFDILSVSNKYQSAKREKYTFLKFIKMWGLEVVTSKHVSTAILLIHLIILPRENVARESAASYRVNDGCATTLSPAVSPYQSRRQRQSGSSSILFRSANKHDESERLTMPLLSKSKGRRREKKLPKKVCCIIC